MPGVHCRHQGPLSLVSHQRHITVARSWSLLLLICHPDHFPVHGLRTTRSPLPLSTLDKVIRPLVVFVKSRTLGREGQLTVPFRGEGKALAKYVMTELGRTAVVALAVNEELVPRVVYPLGHDTYSTNSGFSSADCWWDPPSCVWCLNCCDEKYIQCQLQCWEGPWNCPSCMYLRCDCVLACCEAPPCPI